MATSLAFAKMHGCGNDFIVIDARIQRVTLDHGSIVYLADRHRGIGCDQVVLIEESTAATAKLIFFNGDGSRAQACGNATRCCAAYFVREGHSSTMTFETDGGLLRATVVDQARITVEMAPPKLEWHEIPLAKACDTLEVPLKQDGLPRPVAVSMGNPHLVFFVDNVEEVPIEVLGPSLEQHELLPECGNIGFATVQGRNKMRLRVFERGAGLTLACGSAACAAVVAGVRRGALDGKTRVLLDGGELCISWNGVGAVVMTGPGSFVFEGRVELPDWNETS